MDKDTAIYTVYESGTKSCTSEGKNISRRVIFCSIDIDERNRLMEEIGKKTIDFIRGHALEFLTFKIYSFGNVLDVGCGEHKQGNVGIDRSKSSFADVIALVEMLPFRSNSFDCVVSNALLEHVPDYKLALREMRRVAKSLVIVAVPRYAHSFASPDHLHHFTKEELCKELEETFAIEDVFTVGNSNIFLCQKYGLKQERLFVVPGLGRYLD